VWKIYRLLDPVDGRTRYVGKTKRPLEVRLQAHIHRATRTKSDTHCDRWLRKVDGRGLRPLIIGVMACSALDVDQWEKYWIAKYRETFDLTNITEGGTGGNTTPQGWTEERKQAARLRMKGKKTGRPSWIKGKKQSPEYVAKRRAATDDKARIAKMKETLAIRKAAGIEDPRVRWRFCEECLWPFRVEVGVWKGVHACSEKCRRRLHSRKMQGRRAWNAGTARVYHNECVICGKAWDALRPRKTCSDACRSVHTSLRVTEQHRRSRGRSFSVVRYGDEQCVESAATSDTLHREEA
jgi:predicted nucleic acid-binding Zn ribbon protein